MKKILCSLIVLAFIFSGSTLMAQTQKLGHINLQELVTAMPESDSAQAKLQKTAKEMDSNYQQMQVEFNKKYEEYTKNSKDYNDLVKSTKEAELQDLSKRMQEFQNGAQQKLSELNQKLLKPILDKANKAISDIAREGKFTYVLDTPAQGGTVIFTGEGSIDLMSLVKKKLGLKE